MKRNAFIASDAANYLFQYVCYHNPERWKRYKLDDGNPVLDENNWSKQIKYLNKENTGVSKEIMALPNNRGGIYVFELKGITLPFIENYILYIGRSRLTASRNIRKRALEYFRKERASRVMIEEMFDRWGKYLYYRYYLDDDNARIDKTEKYLIRAILPIYNEDIPNIKEVRAPVPAFKDE